MTRDSAKVKHISKTIYVNNIAKKTTVFTGYR